MKKSIAALTVLMVLSSTAQAAELNEQDYRLNITGEVVLGSCAFQGDAASGNDLTLALGKVGLIDVVASPTDVLNSIGEGGELSLECPPGLATLDYEIKPITDSYEMDVLTNTKGPGAGGAEGVGFKVKAAFNSDLAQSPWVSFANPPKESVDIVDGKVDVAFGANYALVGKTPATPGLVEAVLPFTIVYN